MSCDGVESFKVPVNVMMKTEEHSANAIAAMIASRAPVASQGGRSTTENGRKRIMGSGCSSLDLMSDDNGDEDDIAGHDGKKRRLTFEQVKTLEKNFEVGNKLEPQRKMQLAVALGLQPRQIAVWFQNRRARWKTKQLEKDYDALRREYETLKLDYDALLQENKKFKAEVQNLSSRIQNEDEIHRNVSGLKASEGLTLKSEICLRTAEPEVLPSASDPGLVMKKEQDGCNSSVVSEGSSVLNIDSPRTIDSPLSPLRQDASPTPLEGITSELPCSRAFLVDQSACQKLPKLEESALNQEEFCCNPFDGLEDQQGALLWEYWPQGL